MAFLRLRCPPDYRAVSLPTARRHVAVTTPQSNAHKKIHGQAFCNRLVVDVIVTLHLLSALSILSGAVVKV